MRPFRLRSTNVCLPCLVRASHRIRPFTTPAQSSTVQYQLPIQLQSATQPPKNKIVKDGSNSASASKSPAPVATVNVDVQKKESVFLTEKQRNRLKVYYVVLCSMKGAAPGLARSKILEQNDILRGVYRRGRVDYVMRELDQVTVHHRKNRRLVTDPSSIDILRKLGLLSRDTTSSESTKAPEKSSPTSTLTSTTLAERRALRRRSLQSKLATANDVVVRRVVDEQPALTKTTSTSPDGSQSSKEVALPQPLQSDKWLDASSIQAIPVETEQEVQVPKLSFDLSRVLFNPGVYHLQDPRSRVYNFDPYLEKIMPVDEFNFRILNPYITSSKDETSARMMKKHNKKYRGSSSSLTSVMAHFHYLLSGWRPVDTSILSKKTETTMNQFSAISRAPVSIFLKYQDGIYAVDADKQYDKPNILMMQGKSMEKLLTCERDDFEKFRKPKAGAEATPIDLDPEQYHYTTIGDFLLRAQLDAYDPRLPGTGMFDLKTRAVAGIRFNLDEYNQGMHYEIKDRFGIWNSFDREYYDMIRSAFLKYSLQVRMGRMDGIFVAYHNIARIFGFQYISIQEMDMALHGQPEQNIGDQEFKLSVKLMNEVFNEVTQVYPEQSLKIVFETVAGSETQPNTNMRIYAEPMADDVIDERQSSVSNRMDNFERQMQDGEDPKAKPATLEQVLSPSTLESSAPDAAFLDQILSQDTYTTKKVKEVDVSNWTLDVVNSVNGQVVVRPENLKEGDKWEVQYALKRTTDEQQVKSHYKAVLARRRTAFEGSHSTSRDSYFLRELRKRCEAGRHHRAELDAREADKPKVILYGEDMSET